MYITQITSHKTSPSPPPPPIKHHETKQMLATFNTCDRTDGQCLTFIHWRFVCLSLFSSLSCSSGLMGALTSTVPPVSFNCFRIPWRRGNSSASNWNRQMQQRLKWITAQCQLLCLCLYWLVYQNEARLEAQWFLKYQVFYRAQSLVD